MKRADIFKNIRSGVREYRRTKPAWHKRSASGWLLKLLQTNMQALLQGNWRWQERENYFYRLLSMSVLCLDDNGVITAGLGPPLERVVRPEDTNVDIVLLSIDRGCARYAGNSATDLAAMINYRLNRASDLQPTNANAADTLEKIRDIASLATLGLEITKLNGDSDA